MEVFPFKSLGLRLVLLRDLYIQEGYHLTEYSQYLSMKCDLRHLLNKNSEAVPTKRLHHRVSTRRALHKIRNILF